MRGKFSSLAVAALVIGAGFGAKADSTFIVGFDNAGLGNESDGVISEPFVGSGEFYSPTTLYPGHTYALSSLTGFTMDFEFSDGDSYSESDIATPIDEVAVAVSYYNGPVSEFDGDLRLVFTENGSPADGGPAGGSLDLVNVNDDVLSFEPTYAGGNYEYYEQALQLDPAGNYLAVAAPVPEPAAWSLMLLGLGALGAGLRMRRRTEHASA